MEFLKEILEKLNPTPQVQKLDLNLDQFISDKNKLELYIEQKKSQLLRLEELYF